MTLLIKKRNQTLVPFDATKIGIAISKAFASTQQEADSTLITSIEDSIYHYALQLNDKQQLLTVEDIQDRVEELLMAGNAHHVAKEYILYRNRHSELRDCLNAFRSHGFDDAVMDLLHQIPETFGPIYSLSDLHRKVETFITPTATADARFQTLIRSSLELTDADAPDWEYIAARFLSLHIHRQVSEQNQQLGLHSFYDKLVHYTQKGFYTDKLLAHYSKEEIDTLASYIDDDNDKHFTYSSLSLLNKRYLLRNFDGQVIETPQEMFIGIAMHLAMNETSDRLSFIRDLYGILSSLKVTMATPTLSNARKPHHQLSSCFIDTVDDSLGGIYKAIDNFAKVSKSGGGMGLYFGKVRANGSDIRGFKGVAGGVIRWIKLANDTAVAVDQLGVRQGSVAVYLDVWHKDIPEFLQMKTNNGDDRSKAHDVFPGICYPDLFWRKAKEDLNNTWHLMCPHEILTVKGYSLEDFYGTEWEERYLDCVNDPAISKREISIKDLVRLIIKSGIETGTPFTFNRDQVNRDNPNKHCGIIYSSNLCTEIMQNMSAIEQLEPERMVIDGETIIVERNKPGDFVVCNLASLVLGRIDLHNREELRNIIHVVVRALDNVIDMNAYPLTYAEHTNQRYRAIGLGVSGYHHALVNEGIRWESDEHLTFSDELFEQINYYAIEASMNIAKEKGSYHHFNGSDWDNGAYFQNHGYTSDAWQSLAQDVHHNGLRNGYLLAIAPTGSTSIIAGTTAGIDPVMHKYFLEEKKGEILPRVAPDLSPATYWLYKSAHTIDQHWSIEAAGVRQRHIDQSQSLNLYITTEHSMRQILDLYIHAWEKGIKSIYYIRSKSLEVEECESCAG